MTGILQALVYRERLAKPIENPAMLAAPGGRVSAYAIIFFAFQPASKAA